LGWVKGREGEEGSESLNSIRCLKNSQATPRHVTYVSNAEGRGGREELPWGKKSTLENKEVQRRRTQVRLEKYR